MFGSWNEAIRRAGFTPNTSSVGNEVTAKDGHKCKSLGEKVIDDWLFDHDIPHEKEVCYPFSRMRADWRIFDAFIEYFGLDTGYDNWLNNEYRARIEHKRAICREWNIRLIEIFPNDLCEIDFLNGSKTEVNASIAEQWIGG